MPVCLSASEQAALQTLVNEGGSMLETRISERNERCVFGSVVPGMNVYRKLEKKGLLYFTEEEPLDIPDEGRAALAAIQLQGRQT